MVPAGIEPVAVLTALQLHGCLSELEDVTGHTGGEYL